MSFKISNVSVTLTKTPGKDHHWDSKCHYTLTESDGRVYRVVRPIFNNISEGDIGKQYVSTSNSPSGIKEFTQKAQKWEAHDHGIPQKFGGHTCYKKAKKTPVKSTSVIRPSTPPVQSALKSVQSQLEIANQNNAHLQQTLQGTNAKIGDLTNLCAELRIQINEKNQEIERLRADINANQGQIQRLAEQVAFLNDTLVRLLNLV